MRIRITLIGLVALAAAAYGQQGPGRGPRSGMMPGGGGPGARLLGAEVGMPGRVVKNAPFSADIVTETTQVLPDGNRIKQSSTVKYYRDSDGRTRREQSVQNLGGLAARSNSPEVVFINDPVAGTGYALDLAKRTATKTGWNFGAGRMMGQRPGPGGPPPAGGPRASMRSQNPNIKTESLGRQVVEGVPADGTRTTLTIPAGEIGNEQAMQVVTETWYSPELQTMVLRKRSDPRSGDSVTRYMNISRTEPSRILFEPPVDFKVAESRRSQKQ